MQTAMISSHIILTACLWALGLSSTFDKGINRIFKLPCQSHNWTFKLAPPSDLYTHDNIHDCHLHFNITKDGVILETEELRGSCSLLVIAVNYELRVSTSILTIVSLTEHQVTYKVPSVHIDVYTQSTSLGIDSVKVLPDLQRKLYEILPIEQVKTNYSNIKLSEIPGWKYSTGGLTCTVLLSETTRLTVRVHVQYESIHRAKRQLLSNLHSPVFSEDTYIVSIREELALATQVIQIQATDADEGSAGAIVYSLHADADQRSLNIFLINAESGWVTTNGRVDREDIAEHRFTVRARDQGSPSNSAQATLTIVVEDFNDHAPAFEQSVYNLNVSETVTSGTTVTRVRADDADIGDNKIVVYSIVDAASVTDFTLNRQTGDLSVARSLDREVVDRYSFIVVAEDQAANVADRLSSTVAVNILILDYNDNKPEFSQSDYTLRVREDVNVSSGPVVIGSVFATDEDDGNNQLIRYSITSGNPMPRVFDISSDSGQISVILPLDRDQPGGAEYNLRVKAGDSGVPPRHNVVSVKVIVEDVNDNAPSFRHPSYTYDIFETNPVGQPIATIVASDPDAGRNKQLVYSIVPLAQGAQLPISINSSSGILTNTVELDREQTARYEFVVRVEDGGVPPQSATVDVTINIRDVNDNPPSFTQTVYAARISEDSSLLQEVISVTASDPDANDVVVYSIVDGDASNDFLITKEQQYGVIRVNKLLSYDRKKFYSLRVRATDQSGKSAHCTVTVNVTDKNRHSPVFVQETYRFKISEAEGDGARIGQVEAEDRDIELNGQLTYFMVSGGSPPPFTINPATGEITVNDTLDRDNPLTSTFDVDVFARDHGIPSRQTVIPAEVHIEIEDVNDNAPVFDELEYSAEILENKTTGSSVITVTARDADQPGTANSRVQYTFEGGNDGNGSFYIEGAGGTIRVRHQLDRERVSRYVLTVVARDMAASDRMSSSVRVTVTLLDVNDNAPQFEAETIVRRIYENKPVKSAVQPPIRAHDADLGPNAMVTFEPVGGDLNAFELQDQGDGSFILYNLVSLDYESLRKNYTLEVQASSGHMITKAKVIIKLQDVNDNSPELKNFTIVINNVDHHFPEGQIGRVPAFDPDESDRNSLVYTVKSGNEANFFTLDSSTGYITLNRALGSDRPIAGQFVIQVSDVLNKVNATCTLVYRLITNDMLLNSVTLRLNDMTAVSFMTSVYGYTVQALAEVLTLIPSQIYIIDIKDDTEVDTDIHKPVLNVSFAAVQQVGGKDIYLDQVYIKEQIYRKLDLLKNLSAVTILPFDDTLCVLEPCPDYQSCTTKLQFAEAADFISSEAMLFRPIRTQAISNCRCPTGFAGQNISFSCDTEINLCYSNPCMNSATCQQVEGGYTCLCPTGYKGERCEYDSVNGAFNKSYCPGEVCHGQGSYCVDLLKGGFACHSLDERCEETETHTDTCSLKTVTFVPGSYLMFPALNSRARFNMQISFASRRKSGLILYNGRYNHQHDFIALELINHTAVFTMSFGRESYSVSVGKAYGLNDGQWHTLHVDYRNWILTLSLDQCDVGLSLTHPELYDYPCASSIDINKCKGQGRSSSLCYLDLTGPLLIGGLPGYLNIDRLTSDYFVGCMRDLHVNYKPVDFNSAITDHNTQQGCVYKTDHCMNTPCRNQGTCLSSWGTYRCLCPDGKSGKDCSLRTGPSYTFIGQSHLSYTNGLGSVRKPWYNSLVFKTTVDNRPLLKVELEQSKTIEYRLEGGYITFRYNDYYYVFDEVLLNDDEWHHFEMRLISDSMRQGQIILQADYGDVQRSEPLDNSLDGLSVLRVWVGGDNFTNIQNKGFSGCIKDVKLGDSLSAPTGQKNVIDKCNKPVTCQVQCTRGSSVCKVGWESSKCLCNEGLVGPTCSSVCSSKYSPCQHGSQCVTDRDTPTGYRCLCAEGYYGTYCEHKQQTQCPASWWGSPVCGPCNCSAELNYDSQCNRKSGQCSCKTAYYKPEGKDKCEPCHCYFSLGVSGALSSSCDRQTGQCQCKDGVRGRRCDQCPNPFAEIMKDGCEVTYGVCPKAFAAGLWWTRTKKGFQRIESCPPGSVGNATRICGSEGDGWLEPITAGCMSSSFLSLNRSLALLELKVDGNDSVRVHSSTTNSYAYQAPRILSQLRNSTDTLDDLYVQDLLISVKIVREILLREKTAEAFNLTSSKDRYFTENLVHIVSRLLRPSLTQQWVYLRNISQASLLPDLLHDLDDYLGNLAYNMATKFVSVGMDPFQIVSDNVVMGLDRLRSNGLILPKYNNIKKEEDLFDEVTSFRLPSDLFTETSDKLVDGKAVGGYIFYKTAGALMTAIADENNPYAEDVKLSSLAPSKLRTYGGVTLNSAVVSLALQQDTIKPELVEPVEVTFLFVNKRLTRNAQCVYLNSQGKWTGDLCSVKNQGEDKVVCSCSHFSTYALITDFDLFPDKSRERAPIHTYVVVSLALVCFLFTFFVFLSLKDLKSNYIYNQINIQLCFFLALLVYICGAHNPTNQSACTVAAVLLQFFVLSLFAWIFVNALHLYRILSEKRYIDGEAMLHYIIMGYVIPGVVTALSVGLSSDDFGTETMCWLDITNSMVWSLAGPVLFCCIAVGVLLALCLSMECKEEPKNDNVCPARTNDMKSMPQSAVWVAVAFMPLSCCTWLFALLSLNSLLEEEQSYDYMFSACACVTSVFSLLAHVAFNKRSRDELRRRWKRCQGHGTLEESDTSDRPNNAVFRQMKSPALAAFSAGSESSTTSNSRLNFGASNDLAPYFIGQSSTSSDIPTYSQYNRHRRRRTTSDCSSDSETDSEIRTEREKDIELASSHSSDEDDALGPVYQAAVKPPDKEGPASPLSAQFSPASARNGPATSTFNQEMGFAPPPPYFVTPSAKWSSRISESTNSTHGSQSKLDGLSMDSSCKNESITRPSVLSSFSGGRRSPDIISISPTPYNQHINKSFVNSPSMQDKMVSFTSPAATVAAADGGTSLPPPEDKTGRFSASLSRSSPACRDSPTNTRRASPATARSPWAANQNREFSNPTNNNIDDIPLADTDSVQTQSTIKSHQDDVFMPPPPEHMLQLSTKPGCEAAPDGVMLVETDLDLLNDVNNETQV